MIIGPDFVWLHFPKCAGYAVQLALRTLLAEEPGLVFDPIDPSNVIWHDTIAKREGRDPGFRLGRRRVICGFRRLPHWLLSRVHYEASRGPHFQTTSREMLIRGLVFEQDGKANPADEYARVFSTPRVDHWIRTEHLVEDLTATFRLDRQTVESALRRENGTEMPYLTPLSFWFTPAELKGLYEANPIWAGIEQKIYGSLACDS